MGLTRVGLRIWLGLTDLFDLLLSKMRVLLLLVSRGGMVPMGGVLLTPLIFYKTLH